jgi:hypothetical protein
MPYANPDTQKKYFKKYNKTRYPSSKIYYAGKSLERLYGITWEDKVQMHANQNGLCALCLQPLPEISKSCVDHDHETGKVRGLLHKRCNLDIAAIEKHKKYLHRVIKYLEEK